MTPEERQLRDRLARIQKRIDDTKATLDAAQKSVTKGKNGRPSGR